MNHHFTRREFLGTTAVGGVLLTSALRGGPLFAAAEEGWAQLRPTKIHKVYVGRTGGIYLSRPTEEIGKFEEYLANLETRLPNVEFVGGEQIPPTDASEILPKIEEADGVLLFHLSGHGGDAPKQAMDQIIEVGVPTAVFSQPFSGHGWMYFPGWRKAGKKVVLLPSSDWSELDRVVGLMRVPPQLAQSKILVVRGPQGTPAACDGEKVKSRLGVETIPVSVEETLAAHNAVPLADAEREAEEYWIGQTKGIVEPSRDEIINSSRFYLALKNMMREKGAQAVTSSNCMAEPAKGCLAFSKLNDLGYVGACEGDMDSTLTMLMFQYAFGVPGFISDPVVDTARNALIHFHCTCATKMDGPDGERCPFTIRNQSDSHQGVALDVEQRIGQEVTCAKFVNLDTMLLSTGKIIDVTHDPLGCRTQFVTEVADAEKMFHNWGAGQIESGVMTLLHRVVFYGDHRKSIEDLGALMDFKVIEEA
jgi:hypothetical protein